MEGAGLSDKGEYSLLRAGRIRVVGNIIFLQVGKPPASYCSFLRQYDWNMFTADGLSKEVAKII